MAVIDDTPDLPQPKKRNTKSYKTLAHQNAQDVAFWQAELARSEKEVAGLNSILADARAVSAMWQNTNTFNYRLFLAACGVALAGWLTVLYLVLR